MRVAHKIKNQEKKREKSAMKNLYFAAV